MSRTLACLSMLAFAGMAWGQASPVPPKAAADVTMPPLVSVPAAAQQPAPAERKTVSAPNTATTSTVDSITQPPIADGVTPEPLPRVWGGVEYLLWWVKNQSAPPLLVTSTNPNAFDANGNSIAGGVGVPGTNILVGSGGPSINYGALSGGRVTLGGWLDSEGIFGLEGSLFMLQNGSFSRTASSDATGSPIVGLPVFVTVGNNTRGQAAGQNAIVESFPGLFKGSDTVISHSRLWGGEANGLFTLWRTPTWYADFLVGFRYLDLMENISVNGQSSNLIPPTAVPPGGVFYLGNFYNGTVGSLDYFQTRNQFYGGQIGGRVGTQFGNWLLNATVKVAFGDTHETENVQGSSILLPSTGGSAITSAGGTYALASNIGSRSRDEFSVVPEVTLNLGYNITQNITTFIGYNFLFWSGVARPGNQIDHAVDIRQIPTVPGYMPGFVGANPAPFLRGGDFWAQGINFGIQFRY